MLCGRSRKINPYLHDLEGSAPVCSARLLVQGIDWPVVRVPCDDVVANSGHRCALGIFGMELE